MGDVVAAAANAVEVTEATKCLAPRRLGREPLGRELLGEHVDVEGGLVVNHCVNVALRTGKTEEAAQPRDAGLRAWPHV